MYIEDPEAYPKVQSSVAVATDTFVSFTDGVRINEISSLRGMAGRITI